MNKKNTDDSNNKRLESLKRQAEEFKQKKLQIRNDLFNKDGQPAAPKNNKVTFDDSSSSEEDSIPHRKLAKLLSEKEEENERTMRPAVTCSENNLNTNKGPYVQIESNIKEIFCSQDVFKFQFNNMPEEEQIKTEMKYSDDDEVSNDTDDEKEDKSVYAQLVSSSAKDSASQQTFKLNVSKFLPDFEADEELRTALRYFCCQKTDDELRQDWTGKRDFLVQEYKKKHKRMIRIKKSKENEKLFVWKNKISSNKQKIK